MANVFPKHFYWGASTSSHQVEGGNNNDWKIWEKENADRLAQEARRKDLPDYVLRAEPSPLNPATYISGQACDHYNRFEEDFDIAKQLGHNAHRFSIEWSRVEPEEGKFDEKEIEHYRKVIAALRARGMEPFVTLWHWAIPLWLRDKGGAASHEFAYFFARYAERIAHACGDDARFWITINEPMIWTANAYWRGVWPPQQTNMVTYVRVLRNLIAAHKAAYDGIKTTHADAHVGIAKNNIYFDGGAMKFMAHWWWNHWFLDRIRHCQDFIGLNYYFHNRMNGFRFNQNENEKTSDRGWEIYPEGIYHVLHELKKYKKPIYITENGVADARDIHREKFIKEHLHWVHKTMQEGVDARGYFYWSLLDNFEWDKGFWPRFGLVEMDYKTMKRTVRPSAFAYRDIIKTNGGNL